MPDDSPATRGPRTQPGPFDPASVAIVVVTYNRSHLLTTLLTSICAMEPKPGRIVVIDNASDDDTTDVVESYRERLAAAGTELVYRRLDTNTGGSGGFSAGMETAYGLGAEWIWLMDDDVEVIPDALALLGRWTPRFRSIQGRRYDYDGSPFYWQYRIAPRMGIPIPFAPSKFDASGYKPMNSGCFEGMFVHRSIVQRIGLPDPRFFIYWDDQVYGWLASRITRSVAVEDFILRRTRDIKMVNLGVRNLRASSDAYRYYIMRNRGYIKQYYRAYGAYSPLLFAAGTAATFCKELIRLVAVERRSIAGAKNLWRGLRDAREVAADTTWRPMPPLPVE